MLGPAADSLAAPLPTRRTESGAQEGGVRSLGGLGDQPLVIERISRSCRCTSAQTEESTLEPGASTPLRVGLETPGVPGQVEERVLLRSNDPDTPLLEIRLLATVVEE